MDFFLTNLKDDEMKLPKKIERKVLAQAGVEIPKRRHKYCAVRTVVDGITFSSKKEAKRFSELKLMEKAGKICNLELQPEYPIFISGIKVASYFGDFRYCFCEQGEWIIEDVKGMRTPLYKFKKRCVEAQYGIEITEV